MSTRKTILAQARKRAKQWARKNKVVGAYAISKRVKAETHLIVDRERKQRYAREEKKILMKGIRAFRPKSAKDAKRVEKRLIALAKEAQTKLQRLKLERAAKRLKLMGRDIFRKAEPIVPLSKPTPVKKPTKFKVIKYVKKGGKKKRVTSYKRVIYKSIDSPGWRSTKTREVKANHDYTQKDGTNLSQRFINSADIFRAKMERENRPVKLWGAFYTYKLEDSHNVWNDDVIIRRFGYMLAGPEDSWEKMIAEASGELEEIGNGAERWEHTKIVQTRSNQRRWIQTIGVYAVIEKEE